MAELTKAGKGIKWLIWTFILELMLLLVLIPNHWLEKVVEQENHVLVLEMGKPTASWVINKGEHWYDSLFVETGINYEVYKFFIPSKQQREASKGMSNLGATSWFPWIEGRGDALSTILQQTLQRIALLASWLVFFFLLIIPFAWDGYMQWRINQHSFQHASTAAHSLGMKAISAIMLVVLIGLIVPAPLPPVAIPIMMILVMLSVNIVLRNSQKEI